MRLQEYKVIKRTQKFFVKTKCSLDLLNNVRDDIVVRLIIIIMAEKKTDDSIRE